jgi:hypothetical protein
MTLATWLQAISAGIAILGAFGVIIRYLVKHYLSELKPNHGSSLSDVIRLEVLPLIKELRYNQQKIEVKMDKVESKVDRLEGRFEQHVDEGDASI